MGIKIAIKLEDAKLLQVLKQVGPLSFEIISLSSRSPNFKYEKSFEYTHNLRRSVSVIWGPRWLSWLRHCATSRNVAGH